MSKNAFLFVLLAVTVSVDDNYTIRFATNSDAGRYWFSWSKTLIIGGKEARELRNALIDTLGPDDRCINFDPKTGQCSIGTCAGARP